MDDKILLGGTGASLANGARSIVAVLQPLTLVVGACFVACERTTGNDSLFSLGDNGTNRIQQDCFFDALKSVNINKTEDQWQILGWSKAAGTVPLRGHRSRVGIGSWTHSNVGSNSADDATAWTATEIGAEGDGDAGSFANMRIAVAAVFDRELTDAEYVNVGGFQSTEYLYSLAPVALWEFNQPDTSTAVRDLIGSAHQTSITGTTVITNDDPPWRFSNTTSVAWLAA